MWTSPIRPSSSWRNAPYGVIRWTVPSTTAPTSISAISNPFPRTLRHADAGHAPGHRSPTMPCGETARQARYRPAAASDVASGRMSGIGQAQIDGGVLVAGAILFFIGAGLPPEPSRVFSTPTLEHLRIVGRNARRWRLMNLVMIAGVLGTGTGLWVIAPHLGYRGVAAAGAYAAAAPLWLVWLASRATIEIAAAEA